LKPRLFVGGALVAAFMVACQLLIGLDDPMQSPPPPVVQDPCNPLLPPARPDAADNPNESKSLGFVALHHLYFGSAPDAGAPQDAGATDAAAMIPQGYNLDDTCTCNPQGLRTGPSCRSAVIDGGCDFPRGVDNAVIQVSQKYKAAGVDLDDTLAINKRIAEGVLTLILHVSDYNGQADDPAVGVGFLNAYGGDAPYAAPDDPFCNAQDAGLGDAGPRDGGARDAGDAGVRPPVWNGCDAWKVSRQQTVTAPTERGGVVPAVRADTAFVRDGKLVARGNVPVRLNFGPIVLPINDLILTADVVLLDRTGAKVKAGSPNAFRYRLENGIFAGRVRADEINFAFGSVPRVAGGPPICDPSDPLSVFFYTQVRAEVCGARDVVLIPKFDNQSPLAACDAVSVALPFDADPAYLGTRIDETDVPTNLGGCGALMDAGPDGAPPVIADPAKYFGCSP
jgi:hypothetical protein